MRFLDTAIAVLNNIVLKELISVALRLVFLPTICFRHLRKRREVS